MFGIKTNNCKRFKNNKEHFVYMYILECILKTHKKYNKIISIEKNYQSRSCIINYLDWKKKKSNYLEKKKSKVELHKQKEESLCVLFLINIYVMSLY